MRAATCFGPWTSVLAADGCSVSNRPCSTIGAANSPEFVLPDKRRLVDRRPQPGRSRHLPLHPSRHMSNRNDTAVMLLHNSSGDEPVRSANDPSATDIETSVSRMSALARAEDAPEQAASDAQAEQSEANAPEQAPAPAIKLAAPSTCDEPAQAEESAPAAAPARAESSPADVASAAPTPAPTSHA